MRKITNGRLQARLFLTAGLFILFAVTGCGNYEWGPEPNAGSGSPNTAIARVPDQEFYNGLSANEVSLARQTIQLALEKNLSKENRYWTGDKLGTYGFVTPLRTFRITSGYYCREYLETVATTSDVVSATKIACRDGDAIWKAAALN